jgi:hypothetical protein
MQIGDLVKIHKSGKIVIYLGTVDGCYQFWHHEWDMVWLAVDTLPPEKYEVIG